VTAIQKAEEQYKRTCKKFGRSSKVWTLFGEHYFRFGDVESARKLLPRSLQSLEKRKRKLIRNMGLLACAETRV
jgi:rRNA biogenesis protein RRP5